MSERPGGSAVAPAWNYADWASVLAAFYFDEAWAGQEVLFGVDAASLAEASGSAEDEAVSSLVAAVRTLIGKEWRIARVKTEVRLWRAKGASGAHPALPFLALTVLAASRMGDKSLAAHNYYVPLRRLLDPDDRESGPPPAFRDDIEDLWNDLVRWANADLAGRRGRIVIRDIGHRYVGLAAQHALVKVSDLRHLDAFFRRIGLEPSERVSPAELRRALAVWVAGRQEPWARRLGRISADPELAQHCEAVLEREAARWDGQPRDPQTGRAVGRVRVGVRWTRGRAEVGLYAQWDGRLPETLTMGSTGLRTMELTRWEGWYEPFPLDLGDVGQRLRDGVELRGDGTVFALISEDVYALTYDDDLGAWVSVDRMSYGDGYAFLARREVVNEVLRFLREASSTEPTINSRAERSLPPGWRLIVDARIDSRPRCEVPTALASLVPAGQGPRLRLLGGLPIGPARNVYLRGGEPVLTLSTMCDEERFSIRCLGTGVVESFRASGSEIPLWQYRLAPERYEIRHGESTASLQIVDGIAETAGPGAGAVRQSGRRPSEVVGTSTSPASNRRGPITIKAPRPHEHVFLVGSRPGEVHRVALPVWLAGPVGFEPTWTDIDAWPDFTPAWYLVGRDYGGYAARAMNDVPPEGPVTGTSSWSWLLRRAELATGQSPATELLWQRYQEAVGHVDDAR